MRVADEIAAKLQVAFAPSTLTVLDESENHRGHAGHREGGQSHFAVTLRAPVFAGMSRRAAPLCGWTSIKAAPGRWA